MLSIDDGPRGTGSACALKVDLMLSAELAQAVGVE
jgi:hypothetical protein